MRPITRTLFAAGLALTSVALAQAAEPAGNEAIRVTMAEFVAARAVHISAAVAGPVRSIAVDLGDRVKAGQDLAQVECPAADLEVKRAEALCERARAVIVEVQARVARHQADVGEAEAAVKEAAAQREFQQRRTQRLRDLLKNNNVDQQIVDDAENQLKAAEAKVRQAEARLATVRINPDAARLAVVRADLAVAEVQRDLALRRADGRNVRSPIDGTVVARRVSVGDLVTGPEAGRPTLMFEVADLSRLEVVAELADVYHSRVAPGARVEVRPHAAPGTVLTGRVTRVAPTISPANRTFSVRIQVTPADGGPTLRPGMTAEISIFAK
jgi:multidrug resistance efflux pump